MTRLVWAVTRRPARSKARLVFRLIVPAGAARILRALADELERQAQERGTPN